MTSSLPLYRCAELRRIEIAAADQPLMQRAGRAGAELARTLCRDGAILVLAGPGNNGGDAFEAAHLLREWFFEVHTVFVGSPRDLPMDAADAWQRFSAAGGTTLTAIPETQRWSLIIDGLFGIGLSREIAEPYAGFIRAANALSLRDACPLLALDCPSGLDADTGKLHGVAVRASHTISFICGKPGLFTADGPDHCGQVTIASLELDPLAISPPTGQTISCQQFSGQLEIRLRNSHKGSFGSAGILGGSPGMVGAALLAARAALRLGSGRVYVGLLDAQAPAVDPQQPELMLRSPEALFATPLTALACGPGMGTHPAAGKLLKAACQMEIPLLLDADALNLLATDRGLQTALHSRRAAVLLTPHPAEAARLLGSSTRDVQADRISAAQEIARNFACPVALKGCGTVIASPEGTWWINTSGNPGLASAGMGDVLTGLCLALLGQNWPPLAALLAAVHLHGAAADALVADGCGPAGLTASEVILRARTLFNSWSAAR